MRAAGRCDNSLTDWLRVIESPTAIPSTHTLYAPFSYSSSPSSQPRLPSHRLQAAEPLAEGSGGGNFVGARVTSDVAPLLDGLNLHVYSWYRDPESQPVVGAERGVHPEHPGSTMNGACVTGCVGVGVGAFQELYEGKGCGAYVGMAQRIAGASPLQIW